MFKTAKGINGGKKLTISTTKPKTAKKPETEK